MDNSYDSLPDLDALRPEEPSPEALARAYKDAFTAKAARWRTVQTDVETVDLFTESGNLVASACRDGVLAPAGVDRVTGWNTADDSRDPAVGGQGGRQARMARSPVNLFLYAARLLTNVDGQLPTPEREARACERFAVLCEPDTTPWSEPQTRTHWRGVFHVSEKTLTDLFTNGDIHARKQGKFWRVDRRRLPTDHPEYLSR